MFFESHQNSNLWPRLENIVLEGLNIRPWAHKETHLSHLKSEVANLSLELLSCQNNLSLAWKLLEKPSQLWSSVPLLASCIILPYLPSTVPYERSEIVTNQYIQWLKNKNQSSNFFPPFTVILNFSIPKLWSSIYLFKKCSEGRCRWVWVLAPPPTAWWEGWISNTVLSLGVCPAHLGGTFVHSPFPSLPRFLLLF